MELYKVSCVNITANVCVCFKFIIQSLSNGQKKSFQFMLKSKLAVRNVV